ncbi:MULTISPECIES: catalase-related domain-containing protein [Corallococcus]|uniref:catalase-related domain-containing protein n=1 Tax=Corallococcus TaxID=83461 RepID=UPI001F27C103|nr:MULTISPECIES: catalase-related domain-containing protein [Corallococcus]
MTLPAAITLRASVVRRVARKSTHGKHAEDTDFVQAGALYRLMTEPQKQRRVENLSGSLAQVSREDIITRAISYFRAADEEYGSRVATAVHPLRRAR